MISVLIVNYFCHTLTAHAVHSVLADDPAAQVIVVDNSNDQIEAENLRKILPSRAELVVAPINLGFGRACNLAFEQAAGEWILLLNPDAFILPNCLQQLVGTLQRHPKIGALSPLAQWDEAGTFLLPPGQMQTPAWEWMLALGFRFPAFGRWLSMRFRTYALRCLYASLPVRQRMLSGGHMFLRRSAIDAIGGLFDPAFFMYYEDTDLCRRLTKAGFELMLDPEAKVVHQWRHDPVKSQYTVESRLRYMRKHFTNFWLMDRLRQNFEQLLQPKAGKFHDIGICTTAPIFDLPTRQSGNWLLELSTNPLLIPAAYHSSTVAPHSIPSSVWSLLGAGRYWARVSHPNGQWSYFTWEIPKSISKSGLELLTPKQVRSANRILHLDWAYQSNEAELLDLFRAAFGYQMNPELWRWKYHAFDTLGALVRHNGRAIAFYGAMPRSIHLFGSPATAVQIGDVMVLPEERGILTRQGPFFLAAAGFLERFVGHGKTFPLAFGFPSERPCRLGVRLGLYDKVGELAQINWPALQARPSYRMRLRPLSTNDSAAVDRLWLEMADALQDQVVGVRDWPYVQRRYMQHPTISYQLYLITSRFTQTPIGIIVIRVLDDAVELLDIIAPPQRMATLIHCLRRLTWNLGKPRTYAWITMQHAHSLAGDTGEIVPTGIVIPYNRWTPGISADKVMDRWWLMGGDTDFR
jgi:GT2 family glycosyltransferase